MLKMFYLQQFLMLVYFWNILKVSFCFPSFRTFCFGNQLKSLVILFTLVGSNSICKFMREKWFCAVYHRAGNVLLKQQNRFNRFVLGTEATLGLSVFSGNSVLVHPYRGYFFTSSAIWNISQTLKLADFSAFVPHHANHCNCQNPAHFFLPQGWPSCRFCLQFFLFFSLFFV